MEDDVAGKKLLLGAGEGFGWVADRFVWMLVDRLSESGFGSLRLLSGGACK